jgi:hypothetical protein
MLMLLAYAWSQLLALLLLLPQVVPLQVLSLAEATCRGVQHAHLTSMMIVAVTLTAHVRANYWSSCCCLPPPPSPPWQVARCSPPTLLRPSAPPFTTFFGMASASAFLMCFGLRSEPSACLLHCRW